MLGRTLNHSGWDGNNFSTILGMNNINISLGLVDSFPAVANRYVYVLDNFGNFFQLNASNVSQQITSFTLRGDTTRCSPAVTKDYAYVGGFVLGIGFTFYQLNASDISQQIANYSIRIGYSSPAVDNGYVYIGSKDNNVYQLNATNISQLIAYYPTGGAVDSSPAVANGYVYIGSNTNLYQLNATNISQQIANYTLVSSGSSPAVANGYVYVGSEDHNLYQLNATNISQQIANYTSLGRIISSPAVANGYVYVGSEDHNLYQLNATNICCIELINIIIFASNINVTISYCRRRKNDISSSIIGNSL